MKNKNETLDKLLRRFMDESQAREVKDDLSFADRLFSESPVPAVKSKTVVSIQSTVRHKLRHRRYLIFGKRLTTIAATIAVALLAGLYVLHSEGPTTHPDFLSVRTGNTDSLWNDALYAANLNADPIMKELAELTESIHSIGEETYEPADPFSDDLQEFEEIEFLTKNTDFWKG